MVRLINSNNKYKVTEPFIVILRHLWLKEIMDHIRVLTVTKSYTPLPRSSNLVLPPESCLIGLSLVTNSKRNERVLKSVIGLDRLQYKIFVSDVNLDQNSRK